MKQFLILISSLFFFSCTPGNKEKIKQHTVISAKSIDNSNYELQYPSDWSIDTTDKDYNPDGYFAIDAPVEDAVSMFIIYNNPVDEKLHVEHQVKAHLEKIIKNGDISYFDYWGKFKGYGAVITGKIMGTWKGEVKIFCHSGDNCSFLTVQQYLYNEREIVLPGFQLIESSFTLKK